jgi:hypothetical protein
MIASPSGKKIKVYKKSKVRGLHCNQQSKMPSSNKIQQNSSTFSPARYGRKYGITDRGYWLLITLDHREVS